MPKCHCKLCWRFHLFLLVYQLQDQLFARATRSKCSLNDFHDEFPLNSLGSCSCLTTTVGTVAVSVVVSAELVIVTVTGGCTVVTSAGLIVVAAVDELFG